MLTTYSLGTISYPAAETLQQRLAAAVAGGSHPPALLLLEHPHVYTFGRQGKDENLLWDADELARRGISTHWTDRGGDVTYHGPGQLVGYPVIHLTDLDTLGYLRKLEEVLIRTLSGFGITAVRVDGQTGVWVPGEPGQTPPAKIASIGVRVDAQRVTRHGFALNVNPYMDYWKGIIACGLENQSKTSMAEWVPQPPTVDEVAAVVVEEFADVFALAAEQGDPGAIAGWMG